MRVRNLFILSIIILFAFLCSYAIYAQTVCNYCQHNVCADRCNICRNNVSYCDTCNSKTNYNSCNTCNGKTSYCDTCNNNVSYNNYNGYSTSYTDFSNCPSCYSYSAYNNASVNGFLNRPSHISNISGIYTTTTPVSVSSNINGTVASQDISGNLSNGQTLSSTMNVDSQPVNVTNGNEQTMSNASEQISSATVNDNSQISSTAKATQTGTMNKAQGQSMNKNQMNKNAKCVSFNQFYNRLNATQKKEVDKIVNKYGQPNEITLSHAIWMNKGIWKTLSVHNEEQVAHNFPYPHSDFIETVVSYKIPNNKNIGNLSLFDGSIAFHKTKGELVAMGPSEAMNLLALNFAHLIITGRLSPQQARRQYASQALALRQGRMPQYAQRLLFNTESPAAAKSPDTALVSPRTNIR